MRYLAGVIMKFNFLGNEFIIRKEYVVIGMFILFIMLTLWGWYLKTNQVEVFITDESSLNSRHEIVTANKGKTNGEMENVIANAAYGEKDFKTDNSSGLTPYMYNGIVDALIININTADAEELKKLNGIGNVKAEAIIDYRQNNGFFNSVEEIKSVKGIGEATYLKIKNYITIEKNN